MIVLFPGGFDLLHRGHEAALRVAGEFAGGGRLIVGVNSDRFMADYKRVPARSESDRVADVQETGFADQIVIWEGPDGQDEQILAHTPDVYVASADWIGRDLAHQLRIPSLGWFDEHSISLLFVRRTPGVSTTELLGGAR